MREIAIAVGGNLAIWNIGFRFVCISAMCKHCAKENVYAAKTIEQIYFIETIILHVQLYAASIRTGL